ncbi:MAG: hypothetical protein GXY14_12525, partial [Spirochaetes bacterium]|nr:hypothetical protein [Spirochaetota bacterium]
MRLFRFLARNISYTFALAFMVSIAAWIEAVLSYAIASSFVLVSYYKILKLTIQWLPLYLMTFTIIFFIAYGFLTPAGIPAIIKRHRRLNAIYKNKMDFKDYSGKDIYGDFSDLVMNTTTAAVLFVTSIAVSMAGLAFYKYYSSGEMTFVEFKYMIKMTVLATIIFILILGITVHLMAEYITNTERAFLYNEILRQGQLIRPHALINVAVNFIFFVIIMMISLFSFNAIVVRIRSIDQGQLQLVVLFGVIVVTGALYFARVNAFSILRIL